MRVLMTGGGTGGHVYPAIAIADCIMENEPDSEVAFVGTKRGIENKLIPQTPYKLHHVEIRGLRRSLSLQNLKTAYYVLTAPGKAKKLIKAFRPDIVVGTGGYVCWPVLKAAQDMGIPTALHESNAFPGVAVRMLEKRADRIFLNFKEAAEYLKCPEKVMHTGNPLRGGFEGAPEGGIAGYEKFVLSFGGSMGAERVNEAALAFARDYAAHHPEVYHLHACGSIELEACTAAFREAGLDKCPNVELVEYIHDMPAKMAAADVVVCRAGAMTLSELALQGKAAVLIPSPNVTGNHQLKNAQALENAGAAVIVEEKDLGGDVFTRTVADLLADGGRRRKMAEAVKSFAVPDAKKMIYNELKRLVNAAR